MKKLLVVLMAFGIGNVFAQKSNVESAVIYMRNSEIEDAKKAIDEAAINADTKDDPKMWSVRAAVYDSIYRNPELKNMDKDKEEKFIVACLKCMQLDTKKRFEEYCQFATINAGFAAYNKAIEYYGNQDSKNALKFFQYVLDAMPYDKNGDFKKNNINEKLITKSIADLFYITKDYNNALVYYDKLIKMDYNDAAIYKFPAYIHLNLGDTTKALSFIENGRKRFQTDKDLINLELNIYLAQKKQNVLLDKLNEALSLDEENATLLFVRGNVYDSYSKNNGAEAKHCKDTAVKIGIKMKLEKVATKKLAYDIAIKQFNKNADSLYKAQKTYSALAEKDYNKVVELNPDNLDAYYNLGALFNNRATEFVDKLNSVTGATQTEYDKKWGAIKKVQDSVLTISVNHFMKAMDIAENLPDDDAEKKKFKNLTLIDLYYNLQQVYANMGNEKKTIEMMNKRKALENE